MNLSLHIAWRYLFAKKSHNAINIVSAVSATGVCVVTAALVCVLSVLNGFGGLVEDMFSAFDPDLRITPAEGKHFRTDTEAFQKLRQMPEVAVYSETVEEMALIQFSDKQVPALLKGVDDNFTQLTHIDSILLDGSFAVCDYFDDGTGVLSRAFERCVLGRGLAAQLGIGAHFVHGIRIYAPKRTGRVNMMRPDQSFNRSATFISGVFAVNQTKYDDSYMLISLPHARELFEYADNEATAVELRLTPPSGGRGAVERRIQALLGEGFKVQNRYEQQEDFFRIMEVEKLLTALLLIFILLIASFNVVGSLSMLMIDKKQDALILRNIGATDKQIRNIFLYEGWLISALGAGIGLALGLTVCLLQQHFGFLQLGNGVDYIISAYPVQVQALDIFFVAVIVLALGFAAAWIPTRKINI